MLKRIYINEIENSTIFKFKTENYLQLLTLEKINLLGKAKSKIAKITLGKCSSFKNYWSNFSSF